MREIEAIVVSRASGSNVTADGMHGLLIFEDSIGAPLTLAVPHEELPPLMVAVSQASSQSARILHADRAAKNVFTCEWFEFGWSPDNQKVILSFRMPGGMEMSFEVHRDRVQTMREALEVMEGRASSPPDGSTRQ
jgi:hypothetical protein